MQQRTSFLSPSSQQKSKQQQELQQQLNNPTSAIGISTSPVTTITPTPTTDESWNVLPPLDRNNSSHRKTTPAAASSSKLEPSHSTVEELSDEEGENIHSVIDLTQRQNNSTNNWQSQQNCSLPPVLESTQSVSSQITVQKDIGSNGSSITLNGHQDFTSGFARFRRHLLQHKSLYQTDSGTTGYTQSVVTSEQVQSIQPVQTTAALGQTPSQMAPNHPNSISPYPNQQFVESGASGFYGTPMIQHPSTSVAQNPYGSRHTHFSDDSNNRYPVTRPPGDYTGDLHRVANAAYSKAMKDVAHVQMLTAAASGWGRPHQQQQPIIIQNTTRAIAEALSDAKTKAVSPSEQHPPPPSFMHRCLDFLHMFWQSNINKAILIGIVGCATYFYWEWWQHRKRMDLLQRRIDANPLLKLGQFISTSTDRGRPVSTCGYY